MSKIPTDGSPDPVLQPNAAQNNEHSLVREPELSAFSGLYMLDIFMLIIILAYTRDML